MTTFNIHARYVHMDNATLSRPPYRDGTMALVAEYVDEEGFPVRETLSTNLSYETSPPAPGCVFVKDYSEHEGLPEALEKAGVGQVLGYFRIGPFNSPIAVVRVA